MARGVVTVQETDRDGIVPTYVAADATNGHEFTGSGKEVIHVVNASGGAVVMTIITNMTQDGLAVADKTVSIAAGAERICGAWLQSVYHGSSASLVQFDFDVDTSITFSVFKINTST